MQRLHKVLYFIYSSSTWQPIIEKITHSKFVTWSSIRSKYLAAINKSSACSPYSIFSRKFFKFSTFPKKKSYTLLAAQCQIDIALQIILLRNILLILHNPSLRIIFTQLLYSKISIGLFLGYGQKKSRVSVS